MNKKLVALCSLFCVMFLFSGCGGNVTSLEAASREASNYEISAVLNYDEKTLQAVEKIKYNNTSNADLTELKLHLYPNAFREDVTKFKAVSETQKSRAYPNGFSEGSINVLSTKINAQNANFIIDGDDKNILAIPFEQSLKSGGWVE